MNKKTIIGLVVLVGFTSMLFLNFGSNVGGYMDFDQAEKSGTRAHVVGTWVSDSPVAYDRDSNVFTFEMQDDQGNIRQVRYGNPKPANFEDADKLVIEGTANGEIFVADNILVKCPSKYNETRPMES